MNILTLATVLVLAIGDKPNPAQSKPEAERPVFAIKVVAQGDRVKVVGQDFSAEADEVSFDGDRLILETKDGVTRLTIKKPGAEPLGYVAMSKGVGGAKIIFVPLTGKIITGN